MSERGCGRGEPDAGAGAAGSVGPGRVYLVGAGPGDPGLLTARALELIAAADVIVYDRLIPASALDGARPDAELLYVGKEGGGPSVPQAETEELMIERARSGASVLRLKGGDPFVFGRGGEEALALRRAGIELEVVPGVTAGVAAAAYAGIPVTHRGRSTAVALVTGHTRDSAVEEPGDLDWRSLAAFPGTLVFYMGVRSLPQICSALIEAGRAATEPAAIVERGTLPGQRAVLGTLESIAERAAAAEVKAPAITVVGSVAELASELAWLPGVSHSDFQKSQPDGCEFSNRDASPAPSPLAGVTIAVTRARAQASALARRLGELGAEVVQAPAIRIEPLPGPPLDPTPYDLVCLTSPNGVGLLFERLAAGGRDARSLAGVTVAAIGPGTAAALAEHGIVADVVPERFVAESLVEALAELPVRRALIARAAEAREVLPDALRARGAEVDVLALYETVAAPLSEQELRQAASADYITFTSSSTVRFFLQAAGEALPQARIVSIGPVTSATLREHGLEPHVEAQRHDIDGLVEALVEDATASSR